MDALMRCGNFNLRASSIPWLTRIYWKDELQMSINDDEIRELHDLLDSYLEELGPEKASTRTNDSGK